MRVKHRKLAVSLLCLTVIACAGRGRLHNVNIRMVPVPAGRFVMGTTDTDFEGQEFCKPVREVALPFFMISSTEIMQWQYELVTGENPSLCQGDSLPVYMVSWVEAVRFCNKLSEMSGLNPCYFQHGDIWLCQFHKNGYRLPTEAEWEYACRAGSSTRYYSGDSLDDLKRVGWVGCNSDSTVHPVGTKQPNTWGLYDMHGNVWEYCNNWLTENYDTTMAGDLPSRKLSHAPRVARGGSYFSNEYFCRSSFRMLIQPLLKYKNTGFRIVRR